MKNDEIEFSLFEAIAFLIIIFTAIGMTYVFVQ